jgi:hypothetical protein
MDVDTPRPSDLVLTQRGGEWLLQFAVDDREVARLALTSLTLISHSEFERGLTTTIEQAASSVEGKVAVFATREWQDGVPYFADKATPTDAVARGSDLGSEARVAAIIRNLCRSRGDKLLNHPTLLEMETQKCRALLVVDDFVGSGERASEFLAAIWASPTIRSWSSLHLVRFLTVAYSATSRGRSAVEQSPTRPKVDIFRDCPTFDALPLPAKVRRQIAKLFDRYGTSIWTARGYRGTGASLVFEHGCPDNCPGIFWDEAQAWKSMFPGRSVLSLEASAFPIEMARRDPTILMIGAGQPRLARSGALTRRGPIGAAVLVVLALVAQGQRSRSTIGFATGYNARDVGRVLEKCLRWKFITPSFRLTPAGAAELRHAKLLEPGGKWIPPLGSDEYYPMQLRGPADD